MLKTQILKNLECSWQTNTDILFTKFYGMLPSNLENLLIFKEYEMFHFQEKENNNLQWASSEQEKQS